MKVPAAAVVKVAWGFALGGEGGGVGARVMIPAVPQPIGVGAGVTGVRDVKTAISHG